LAFDIHTLAAAAFLSVLIQTAALFAQFRLDKRPAGTGWWAAANASICLGFVCNYARDLPVVGNAAIALNNVFFLFGLVLIRIGVARFFGKREPAVPLWTVFGAASAVSFFFTYIAASYAVRRLNVSLGVALFSLSIAKELFVNRPRRGRSLVGFLAAVFVSYSAFFLFRAVSPLFAAMEAPFSPAVVSIAMYTTTLVATMLWTFGFILLVSQRFGIEIGEDRENLRIIFDTSPDMVLITRFHDGVIVDVNGAFCALTGYSKAESVGKSTISPDSLIWNNPLDRQSFVEHMEEKGACDNAEYVFRRKDGGTFTGMISARLITLRGESHLLSVIRDISERIASERRIQQLAQQLELEKTSALRNANTDGLTGLANRRHFDETLHKEFFRAKRTGVRIGLIMLDVDRFKNFNDSFGHLAGDDCLRRIAGVLSSSVKRAADLPARYGGEEFAVIVPEADPESVLRFAELIRTSVEDLGLAHPANEGGIVTVSLGAAAVKADYLEDPSALIKLADEALYQAKRNGRNRTESADLGPEFAVPSAETLCLYWNDKNDCGRLTIDTQHRRLFDDVNLVLARMPAGAADPAFLDSMDRLVADVSAHFRDEEALLREEGYPEAEAHAKTHEALETKAKALLRDSRDGFVGLDRLVSFLVYDLVLLHMQIEDKKFFPFLRMRGGRRAS